MKKKNEKKAEVKAMPIKQVLTLALRELRKSLNVCLRNGLTSEAVDIVAEANDAAERIYKNKVLSAKFASLTQDELDYLENLIKVSKHEVVQEEVEG